MPTKEANTDRARTSPTPEELREFRTFCLYFPAFLVTPENTAKLFTKMWSDRGDGVETTLYRLENAFRELVVQGGIRKLDFGAVGLNPEDAFDFSWMTNEDRKTALRHNHKNWGRLLKRTSVTADEIQAGLAQEPVQRPDAPTPKPAKDSPPESLASKINNMGPWEYRTWLENPANKAALDRELSIR